MAALKGLHRANAGAQKCCPLSDKQVIISALGQLRINFTSIFKVLQKCCENLNLNLKILREINPQFPSGPCDSIYTKRLWCNADIQMFPAFSLMVHLCWKNVVFQ